MPKVISNPKNLPPTIIQVSIDRLPKFAKTLLDSVTEHPKNKVGVKRHGYYIINTYVKRTYVNETHEKQYLYELLAQSKSRGAKLLMILY